MRETPETTVLLDLPGLRPIRGLMEPLRSRRLRPPAPAPQPKSTRAQSEAANGAEITQRAAMTARIERRLDDLLETVGPSFALLVARLDFARWRTLADIGGMTGLLSCLVADRYPQVACRSCDLDIVRPIAERRIRERGLAGRVRAETIDFLADEFPAADVVTMSVILHDWNVQRQKMLIAKAYRALPIGGAMVAIACLDAEAPAKSIPAAANGTLDVGDSWDLTGSVFQRWCAQAGFARCEVVTLGGTAGATIAYK